MSAGTSMIMGSISSGCAFELLAFFCVKVIIVAIATTDCYETFEEGNHMKSKCSHHTLNICRFQGCSHRVSLAMCLPQGSITLANKRYMSMERAECALFQRSLEFPLLPFSQCVPRTYGEIPQKSASAGWWTWISQARIYLMSSVLSAVLRDIFSALCCSLASIFIEASQETLTTEPTWNT